MAGLAALTATAAVALALPARSAAGQSTPTTGEAVAADVVRGAAPGVIRAVPYGQDGGSLTMDVYLPARDAGPVPIVLVVHGGGWSGGSRSDTASEAQALAGAGMAALNVDYRLAAPSAPGFPAQLSDLDQALSWARSHAAGLGLDPGRVGVLGLSAGGNLALDLGVRGLVSAVVAWSAPTDLTGFETPQQQCTSAACGPLSMPYAVYRELGCLPGGCPAQYAEASPSRQTAGLRAGPGGRGVAVDLWSSASELIPQSQADGFVNAARAAGAQAVAEHVLPGSRHAGQYASVALGPTVAFLATALGAQLQ